MKSNFEMHIASNFPHLKSGKLLLAVSGGLDSMVMLHLIQSVANDVSVAHANFSLRRLESDGDEVFVRTFCLQHKIPVYVKKFETQEFADEHKLSIQQAARQLRYEWFEELCEREGFDFVLTAHHLDDQLETFLIHLVRGTGLQGLTGIPEQQGNILRPLLAFSRKQLEDYAQEQLISWREDSSNQEIYYLRNKLRQNVVPLLKELNPSFLDGFNNTLHHLKQSQSLVNVTSEETWKAIAHEKENSIVIDLKKWSTLPYPKAYLYAWLSSYGFTAWDDILYLAQNAPSGKIIYSPNYRLLKNRQQLILEPILSQPKQFQIESLDEVDGEYPLIWKKVTSFSECDQDSIVVDADALKFPLILRHWKEGDYFYPSGMQGKKKLSKFFKDEKIPVFEKEKIWLLCSENKIIWVVGYRTDRRFQVESYTQNLLKFTSKK
ncbi:MAG: tRNA lysidine(34) synthetase TilS [Flavobacterium sp.]